MISGSIKYFREAFFEASHFFIFPTLLCLSFNPLTPMSLKFLVTPNRISLKTQMEKNQLIEELMFSKEEIKHLKNMNMMFLNTQKP